MVSGQSTDRIVFVWLVLASLVGSLLGVPYTIAVLTDPASGLPIDLHLIWLSALIEGIFLLAPACAIGVWLGKRVGLGPRVLSQIVSKSPRWWVKLRYDLWRSILLGTFLGVLGLGQYLLPKGTLGTGLDKPNAFECFLRALSAGITEEVFFRLGLMTLLVWVIRAIVRKSAFHVPSLWIGNGLAALVFASAHLPHILTSGSTSWDFLIPFVLVSSLAGVIMGWMYMRYGFICAAVAHFTIDLVVYVGPRILTVIA
jgi:hypothetical protein